MNKLLSESDLIDYFIAGSKEKENWTIGTENEKFLFGKEIFLPVPYDGSKSIVEIFRILISEFSWKPILEEEKIIGLTDIANDKNITLEPGGQIELSGAKCSNLHQTFDEIQNYNKQLEFACKKLDFG